MVAPETITRHSWSPTDRRYTPLSTAVRGLCRCVPLHLRLKRGGVPIARASEREREEIFLFIFGKKKRKNAMKSASTTVHGKKRHMLMLTERLRECEM
eukprot:scaffold6653_cov115-Isochrysis_galbana.AAC.7